MAHSRKKLVTEYKGLLKEKIQRVNDKEQSITDYITNVSKQALEDSRSLLEETDKKLFLKRYQDVSSQLEVCMNTLLMVSSRLPSHSTDSSSSSSSSDSDDDDDNDDQDISDKPSADTSDKPPKSSQSSHHSQTSLDSKGDRNELDKSNKDGKKVSGDGDSRPKNSKRTNSQRRDRELYQSPKARSLLSQLVHASPKQEQGFQKPQIRRAQSYEHLKTSHHSGRGEVKHPRHSSSPARLGCKPQDYWKSSQADQRSQSTERRQRTRSSSSPPPKSPTTRRRSPASPVLRQKFASTRPRSPPFSRQKSPGVIHRSPIDLMSLKFPQKTRRRSPVYSRSYSLQSKQYHGSKSTANRSRSSKDDTTSLPARQLQYRKLSPSPERRVDSNRHKSSIDHKAPYAKRYQGDKNDNPWYACSSPPRSGDLVKDHVEEKKHRNMELSLQPLVIPTEELEQLSLEVGSSRDQLAESHAKNADNQRFAESNNTNKMHTVSIPTRGVEQKALSQKSPPPNAEQALQITSDKKPPGLQKPSAVHSKALPHSEMTNRSAQNNQRQVTSLASGSLQVTVNDSKAGTKATPMDITTKLHREPPGLKPLTELKAPPLKGPREVLPPQQMTKTLSDQTSSHPGPTGTLHGPREVFATQHQAPKHTGPTHPQGPREVFPTQQKPKSQSIMHPVLTASLQGPKEVHPARQMPRTPVGQPSRHPEPTTSQPQKQQGPSRQPQANTGTRLATPCTLRPAWKPILTHGSVMNVMVTECTNPGDFYVQPVNTPLQQLMMDINEYMQNKEVVSIQNPICGSICLAQWITVDGCWYRAAIKSVAPSKEQKGDDLELSVGVIFIDYGNEATVPVSCLRVLHPQLQNLPPQAVQVSLSNVKPCKGSSKWSAQAAELFKMLVQSVEVQKILCAKVTVMGRISVDLTFKETKGQITEEINIASELVQHGVAEYILAPATAAIARPATQSARSRSSSDGTGSLPQTPSDAKTTQPAHGHPQQQVIKVQQQQQQHTQPKQSTSRNSGTGASISTDPSQPNHPQQAIHCVAPPGPQIEKKSTGSVKQESVSSRSRGDSVASCQKAGDVKRETQSCDGREQKQQQQLTPVVTKPNPGMTLAQTIAAQAAETFHDDARSVCSSRSTGTGSMQTARCESSSTSMHTAYEGGSGSAASQSSQRQSGSRQGAIVKRGGTKDVPKKVVNKHPQLAPRHLNTHSNDSILVAMSHVIHPHEFYVHLITSDIRKLDYLQTELRETYEKQYKDYVFADFVPDVGIIGVSKYYLDDMWYRIQVVALEERAEPVLSEENEDREQGGMQYRKALMAKVLFVDFGNTEWVQASDIKPLQNRFFDFPAQAIKCSLAHIEPEDLSRIPNFQLAPVVHVDRMTNPSQQDHQSSTTHISNYCALCFKQMYSAKSFRDHIASRGHQENEMATKVGLLKPVKVFRRSVSKSYYCALCSQQMYSAKIFRDHIATKAHEEKERAAKAGVLNPSQSIVRPDKPNYRALCNMYSVKGCEDQVAGDQKDDEAAEPQPHQKPSKMIADMDNPSSSSDLQSDGKTVKTNYCEVCSHQAKNDKEYNDHLGSGDHLLADKMARFCETSVATTQLEPQDDHAGWSQIAIDIFKQLAPCENHRMLAMLVRQMTREDEAIPLILSYHEGAQEVCINQELVNVGVATSTRFQKKVFEASNIASSFSVQADSNQELMRALQAWNQPKDPTGYSDTVIPAMRSISGNSKSQFPITFILTVPENKDTNNMTHRQVSMAMETWNVKDSSGYGAIVEEENEQAAMDTWDPKTSDYYSERNSLDVDDEDVTAAVGYSHVYDRRFCKFYIRNQKCYRGDQCPYEHPQPGEDLRDQVPVFYAPTDHSPPLPQEDDWVTVEVTSLHNAFHFWVQMPWGRTGIDTIQGTGTLASGDEDCEGLHALEKSINECCKVKLRTEDPNILRAMGEVVIAKYSRNKRWYRARIIDYDETEPCLKDVPESVIKEFTDCLWQTPLHWVKVFYVDYGNAEWLPRADVRTPKPEFLHLPFQAVECFLYGVAPIKGKEDMARRNMEPLVMDKTLVAHIISSTEATNTMEVQLFNTNGKQDISISQHLLLFDYARALPDHALDKSAPKTSKRLKRMSERDEPDSVSCHEIEIPG